MTNKNVENTGKLKKVVGFIQELEFSKSIITRVKSIKRLIIWKIK